MPTESEEAEVLNVKESRLEHPTGWMTITHFETVRFIIDALIEAPPGHKFNKSQLARRSGMSREAIREHLSLLLELGVIEEINDKGWAEYKLNTESRVTKELVQLNNAVNAVLSGQSKEVDGSTYVISSKGPSMRDAPNLTGAVFQSYTVENYSEKSQVAVRDRVGIEPQSGPNIEAREA